MASSILRRPFDLLICVFYGVQVPIAIFLDSQAGAALASAYSTYRREQIFCIV